MCERKEEKKVDSLFGVPITWSDPLEGKEDVIVLGTLDGYIVPVRIDVLVDSTSIKARDPTESDLLYSILVGDED